MPKKPKSKPGKKPPAAPALYPINPVDYLTLDFRTSIDLLSTSNEEVKLRAIGRLQRCLAGNPDVLSYIIRQGLHVKFLEALKTENVYILRFAFAIIKLILKDAESWKGFTEDDIVALSESTQKVFVESEDPMLKNLTSEVLLLLTKSSHSSKTTSILCTREVISRLFDMVKMTDALEVQDRCLHIFYYLLEAVTAEEVLIGTPNFSVDLLLCFLQMENHPLKPFVVNIIHKIAGWESSQYLKLLCEKKTMEIATNLMLENVQEYKWDCYEILYYCLKQEGADVQYSKTLEFLKFLEWGRNGDPKERVMATNIITLMSRNDESHQLLLDFGIDEVIISLMKDNEEGVLGTIFEAVNNLTRHMHMCYKMTNDEMMTLLIGVLSNRDVPKVPYGELALKTLHRFFKCNPQTVHVVCNGPSLMDLLEQFYTASEVMTQTGFSAFLEIMQFIVQSKYIGKLLNISLYTTLMELFRTSEDTVMEQVLGLVKDLMLFQEFREYFLEKDGLNVLMGNFSGENYSIVYGSLLLLKYLVKFKKPAYFALDTGIVARLLELHERLKGKTCLCDEILHTLFDLCLTAKFFYTSSLSVTDRIRDQFYLLPDELLKSRKEDDINLLTCYTPIYVVLYGSIMKFQAFKLKLPAEKKCDVNQEASNVTNQLKRSGTTKYRINLIRSALAVKFAQQICQDELRKKQNEKPFTRKHRKRCEDERLGFYIREVYEELHYGKTAVARKHEKIAFIARYVADHLNDFYVSPERPGNKRHIMNMHLLHLKDVLKSNFIPIGYLRKGLTRERSLLFKVLCDQVDVATTLNRHVSGVFWNGVTLIKSNPRACSDAVISVQFIVDLMVNVGELIPVQTSYADNYFRKFSSC